VAALGFIPNTLHAKLALLKGAVYAEFHRKRFGCQGNCATQFFGSFGEHMEETLFEPTALVALPVFVVLGAQVNDILARM